MADSNAGRWTTARGLVRPLDAIATALDFPLTWWAIYAAALTAYLRIRPRNDMSPPQVGNQRDGLNNTTTNDRSART